MFVRCIQYSIDESKLANLSMGPIDGSAPKLHEQMKGTGEMTPKIRYTKLFDPTEAKFNPTVSYSRLTFSKPLASIHFFILAPFLK